jgi:hypothetical protein
MEPLQAPGAHCQRHVAAAQSSGSHGALQSARSASASQGLVPPHCGITGAVDHRDRRQVPGPLGRLVGPQHHPHFHVVASYISFDGALAQTYTQLVETLFVHDIWRDGRGFFQWLAQLQHDVGMVVAPEPDAQESSPVPLPASAIATGIHVARSHC